MKQKTIEQPCSFFGIGIHSGKESRVKLLPLPENSGIIINGRPLSINNVSKTNRGTTIGNVSVTEHLLAAIYALGIDNAAIQIEGEEVPILDGSALPFVEQIKTKEQKTDKQFITLKEQIIISDGNSQIVAEPFDKLQIDFAIDFPVIGKQAYSFTLEKDRFRKEIAPARTFGFEREIKTLKKQNLGQGASLDNALGIGKNGYLNQPRFDNEPVRHKILDLVGDLALLNQPIQARIKAIKSGHRHNIELVRRILKSCQS